MQATLITNPADDRIFSAYAQTLLEHGAQTIVELERRLRTIYPHATIHSRDLSGESTPVWYVYRDGHWTPRGGDPLNEETGTHAGPTRRSASDRGIDP
jgi:hypothetical protein